VGTASQSPWEATGVNFTIPYYSMSLALNILVTLMIVTRLLIYRRRIVKAMGSTHGSQYTSLTAMIIESAAIYSLFSLLFLIPFALGHSLSQVFIQALSPTQNVATFLIVFRVAQGKGWSQEAANTVFNTENKTLESSNRGPLPMSRIRFKPTAAPDTSTFDDDEYANSAALDVAKPTLSRAESSDVYDSATSYPDSSSNTKTAAVGSIV
jgi:hypothetical protein